jgi:RNA polymerase sigma factor FliA
MKKISDKELINLWYEYKKSGDDKLRDMLITNYLYIVKTVAGRLYAGMPQHVRLEDMYSAGIIGLIKAVERFDLQKKNQFSTYAYIVVKGAIIDDIRSLDWIPRSIHQKANMISKAQNELAQKYGREPSEYEISEHLNIDIATLQKYFEQIRPVVLISLNAEVEDGMKINEIIADPDAKMSDDIAHANEFKAYLRKTILALPERERTVLALYYYESMLLKEIGEVMGISESRVSQIHSEAVTRLRRRIKGFVCMH